MIPFRIFLVLFTVGLFVLGPDLGAVESSFAGNYIVPEEHSGFKESQYEVAASDKLERGAENFFLGWLEIPHGVKSEFYYRKQQYLAPGVETFFLGLFRGLLNGIGRTAVGFYEMTTFPYPQGPMIEKMDEWLY